MGKSTCSGGITSENEITSYKCNNMGMDYMYGVQFGYIMATEIQYTKVLHQP